MHRIGRAALLAYVVAAMLAGTLVIAAVLFQVRQEIRERLDVESPYVPKRPWSDQLALDQYRTAFTFHYEPYVVSRQGPFHSETINVDSGGVRLTPASHCKAGSFRIFTYGGSTMWGFDVPDWGTIPNYLQLELARVATRPFCIVNHGEWFWVSTQEIMQLNKSLSRGDVPDAMVFYDGYNDVASVTEPGFEVGNHVYMSQYRARLGGKRLGVVFRLLAEPALKAARSVQARFRDREEDPTNKYEAMTMSSVELYARNYRIVESLARSGAKPFMFFWQPTLTTTNKPLTTVEAEMCATVPLLARQLLAKGYAVAAHLRDSLSNFRDLSGALDRESAALFVDAAHLSPEGNQVIARAMFKQIIGDSAWARALGIPLTRAESAMTAAGAPSVQCAAANAAR